MRIMHTMLRVGNLDRSITFHTDVLGMRLLSKREFPDGKFTIAFVGYASMENSAALELTFNWDTDHYDIGNAYGHVAIGVDDVYNIAFVEDPDGYKVEVVEDSPEDD